MKEVWVLYERSDLARVKGGYDWENYQTECKVFATFGAAKTAFLNRITSYGCQNSSLFDGNGGLKNMDIGDYLSQLRYSENAGKDEAFFLNAIKALRQLCSGQKVDLGLLEDYKVSSWSYAVEVTKAVCETVLRITPEYDGPVNCINPYLLTNAFVMEDEYRNYCFYVEDLFHEGIKFVSHLFIDLKRKIVQQ